MASDVVLYESRDRIATITLNRPEKLNALSNPVVDGFNAAWRRFQAGDDLVAVVTGAGDRAFTAGADFNDMPRELWAAMPGIGAEVDKPVIMAIDGYCIGGGAVMLAMCDLAVATERSIFSYPEAQIGVSGGMIVGLASRIPHKVAMEFMLLGQRMTAQRAYEVGMINKVVPVGQEMVAAMEYARILAHESAPLVVQGIKRMVQETQFPKSPSEQHGVARRLLLEIARSEDAKEGAAAFHQKRKPVYKGR